MHNAFSISGVLEIICRYSEPHRRYHTMAHVSRMFELAVKLGIDLSDAHCIAIIMHDAIYRIPADPGVNEEESADLLSQMYRDGLVSMSDDDFQKAVTYIRDTFLALSPRRDEIVDWTVPGLDLYALGTEEYWSNRNLVREEYCMVLGSKAWHSGRLKFLQSLHKSPYVINKSFFRSNDDCSEWHRMMTWNVYRETKELNNG